MNVGDVRARARAGGRLKDWQAYLVAISATVATLGLRIALHGQLGGQGTLVIFTLPIMLSAYLGGLRAGLLATAVSYFGASYYLLPPIHSFAVASSVERWQQFFVALVGVYISGLSELLHRVRARAEIATRQHQRVEEANVRALERLNEAQHIAQIGDWEFDLGTGEITWSPQTFAILGRDPNLGPPRNYAENAACFEPASATLMAEKVAEVIASGNPQEYELVAIRADGLRVPVQAMAVPRKDRSGQVIGLKGTVQDVSARKRADAAVRESEEKFRAVADQSLQGIVLYQDGIATFVNAAFCKIMGYSREEALAHTPAQLFAMVHAENSPMILDRKRRYERGEPSEEVEEIRVTRKDGAVRWVLSSNNSFTLQGKPARLGITLDITARKHAEAAVRGSEARLRGILDTMFVFVGLMDLDGVIVEVNHAPLEAAGLKREDVLGKAVADAYWFSHSPVVQEQVRRGLAGAARGEMMRDDYLIRIAGGGYLTIDTTFAPLRDASGRVTQIVGSAVDITERKDAERKIVQLNAVLEQRVVERTAQLEAANKELEAASLAVTRDLRVAEAADQIKSAFLATMSHELRTPLNSIIGFTGIVLMGKAGPLNAEQTKQLEMVRESAWHLLALINDVLDLSKIEAGQIEVGTVPFHLPASIERVLAMIGPAAQKKGLLLAVEVAPELGEMVSDQRRVEQILLNLLSNAVKFTDHGRVLLTAELLAEFQSSLEAAPFPAVRFRVADTGTGILPEDLLTLFHPFRQIDSGPARHVEGTGLGLAICRRLATLLGGQIAAASTWSQGSEFTVILPLKSPSEP